MMASSRFASAQRTNENSPAPLVLGSRRKFLARAREPGERGLIEKWRTGALPSASRTEIRKDRIRAINRWAIFVRPRRGLFAELANQKFKIPSPHLRAKRQAGDGIFTGKEIPTAA
jgi:hypothetical protein